MRVFRLSLVGVAAAVYGGVEPRPEHSFAGYLGIPNEQYARAAGCDADAIYLSCGGSLVDIPSLPTLSRRIFLTAGHCAVTRDNAEKKYVVSFDETDARVIDTTCRRVTDIGGDVSKKFTSSYMWTPFDAEEPRGQQGDPQVGVGKLDYALLLLDEAVPAAVVPTVGLIADTSILQNIPETVGMAGYGIVGYGEKFDGLLGKPVGVSGERDKMYIELKVRSVQPTNILAAMVVAKGEQSACSGDSGSAGFHPATLEVYGLTASGDQYCRATNTFTRVGTRDFWQWLSSIAPQLLAASSSARK